MGNGSVTGIRPRVAAWLLGWGLFTVIAATAAAPAQAASYAWQSAELMPGVVVQTRLVSAVTAVGSLDRVPAGLHVVLPEGWKTYWRSPGDAGLPPSIDWAGSENLREVRWQWPAPHRFTLFGIETFGYDREILFPLDLVPERPGEPIALTGRLDLLVCSDLCVPARLDLALTLPAGPAMADEEAANLIGRFAALVPGDGRAAGLDLASIAASPNDTRLQIVATAREPFAAPDIFIEAGIGWAFGQPETALTDGGRHLTADLPILQRPDGEAALDGMPVAVTLVDGPRAFERAATIGTGAFLEPSDAAASAPAIAPVTPAAAGLLGILGIALLGGLILNVMPCVLPVLSLKLMSAIGHSGRSPLEIRLGFLASAAGILTSFLVLAGGALALRAAGAAAGWGIQFQQPLFLVFMIVILTLFACNLLGLFEIVLPGSVADAAGRVGGEPGQPHGPGLAGHFATGAFAALLATPCSAPFLGTAVGFALSRGPTEILAVFLALGLGLALPYLAVALVPRLAMALPRPGRWMITLKRLLSLALVATAFWLLAVLAVQVDYPAVAAVGLLMAGLVLVLWARRRLEGGARLAGAAAAGLFALFAFLVPDQLGRQATAAPSETRAENGATDAVHWHSFDAGAIAGHLSRGQVVMIDVTAEWCLTCQVNKALVLNRGETAAALADPAVVAMRADWTRPDDGIAAFLTGHGRYGIPFNVVYGPGAPEGVTLPELLTQRAVLEALARAAGRG